MEEAARHLHLLRLAESWSAGGVDFIQLREKDLDARQLQSLAREMVERIEKTGHDRAQLLVNIAAPELATLALAAGADGVHLAGKPTPGAVNTIRQCFRSGARDAVISLPCHHLDDIRVAVAEQVDLLLFSPVFEKLSVQPQGLKALQQACVAAGGIPVFALGGVTPDNAPDCLAAGASGVAGIRLFAAEDWRLLRA